MARIIAVANQKGGVGKTTTAINLSAALAHFSRKVLIVDMDPQGNSSMGLGVDISLLQQSIIDVLLDEADVEKVMKRVVMKNLYLLPAKLKLAEFDSIVYERNIKEPYHALKNALDKIENKFDYIIIDCPPSLGFLTRNALVSAHTILIPVQCEYFALEAVSQMLATISNIQSTYNPNLGIEGFLITMFDVKTKMSIEIAQQIRHLFKENTFLSQIPRSASIPDSNMKGLPVVAYRPSSSSSLAYFSLAKEIIDHEERF